MKKLLLFIVVLLFCATPSIFSQNGKYFLGVKLGINEAFYNYSHEGYANYDQDINTELLFGISGEYFFTDVISIKPDMLFIGRGINIVNDAFEYDVEANYFELNAPFTITMRDIFKLEPYILAGPYFGFLTGGDIYFDEGEEYDIELSMANMSSFDMGYRLGIGVRKNFEWAGVDIISCTELAYSGGLLNTFASDELDEVAIGLNEPDYYIKGTRKNKGWEVSFSVLIPFGKKKEYTKGIPTITETVRDTVFIIPDQYCYTIDEILSYHRKGLDVTNRKICMFDINFEHNKSVLKKDSKKYLDKIVKLMKEIDKINVNIHGHTDSDGDEDYNLKLSTQRAKAVYQYIINEGISSSRLTYTGHGEEEPIDNNNSKKGKAKNRRVEFEIVSSF